MDELIPICEERNISVVEDASESLGTVYNTGKYNGKFTGTVGDIGCLSFNGNKIITSGSGGMILTNNAKLAKEAHYLTTQAKDDPINYIHNEVGYNFRLSNMLAALGLAQTEQLPVFLKNKRNIFIKYRTALKNIEGLEIASCPTYANNNHWMDLLEIDSKAYGEDSKSLFKRLERRGIQTRPIWALNHLQKPYRTNQSYRIDLADKLVANSLCLPCSVNMKMEEHEEVIRNLEPGHI